MAASFCTWPRTHVIVAVAVAPCQCFTPGGIQTTLPFHRHMAVDPGFRAGPLPIDWVDEHWAEALRPRREAALEAARWAAAAAVANIPARSTALTLDGSTPWIRAGRQRAIERWPR